MNINLSKYGEGSSIVFFHGWGFNSGVFEHLLPNLIDKYQIILVDLPGFGSSKLLDWQDFKQELLVSLPEQFVLAGWSLGGLYATRLALEAPDRVQKLINIASSPRFIIDESWPGVAKEIFASFHKNLTVDLTAALRGFVALQSNNTVRNFDQEQVPTMEALNHGLGILEHWDLRHSLKNLNMPTCYLFGRLDPITSPSIMKIMQHLYPEFHYVLFNKAAHMPFLSHTKEFISELLEFIQ